MKNTKNISDFKKSLRIRGHTWRVSTKFFLRDDDGTPCLGLCDFEKKQIFIEKDLPVSLFVEVLLHEYMHACWFYTGIEDEDVPKWIEHVAINSFCKEITLHASFWGQLLTQLG